MQAATFLGGSLSELQVRPVERREEARYQAQMARHHYLGKLPKIGETVWYVATWHEQWVAQLSLSAAALKCGVRDRWIGWDFRSQYGRLKLHRQQQSLPDPSRLAPAEYRLTGAVADRTAGRG